MNWWKKASSLLWMIALLGAGCATVETIPTLTPPSVSTNTTTPTPLPNPSATPIPEAPPIPALKTTGPYLVYFSNAGEQRQLVLMDADGMGRKVIPLPAITDESFLTTRLISPDGKWFAYYLGSAQQEKDSNLTLNLLNLETSQSHLVSRLLSKDYPNNFTQAAKDLNDPFITAETLQQTFLSGIAHSIGWSPNGQYLAFAGQMDGTSSDVYIYDLKDQSIRRLTRGPDEVLGVSWSPDGSWIIVSGEQSSGEGSGANKDAISLDGKTDIPLPYHTGGSQWHSDYSYMEYDAQNGPGRYALRSVDIRTGKAIKVWDGSFQTFTLDIEKALVVVLPLTFTWPPKDNEDLPSGPYLINIQNGKKTELEFVSQPSFFGIGNRRFFTRYEEAYFIATDGTLIPADPQLDNLSVAPDKQHWVSISETLKVFTADDVLLFNKPLPFTTPSSSDFSFGRKRLQTLWQPDSAGLFMAVDHEIYHLDLSSGEINLVETGFMPESDWFFTK